MKQILQSLSDGKTYIEEVPCPSISSNSLLIQTSKTLISSGTERMLLEFGKAGLLGKIRKQPDKVKMVLEKIKTDGLFTTLDAVKAKLDEPIALGYCNVGTILEIGKSVCGYKHGQRVVSNGSHAEVVSVPQNLVAKIPDNVSDEEAVFTVLASIGLQGIRLANPTIGECVVVIGLGIIGLLTVQLLIANGCRVLGIDFDGRKCELAKQFGAEVADLSQGEDPIIVAHEFSRGRGVDAVLITAATNSNEPVHQAAEMCRKRGRIILVGVVGLELSRADFYEKELTFQVSCSYGPGRYDPNYEVKGQDYPLGFVRWTEQRNFEAVLDMMSQGKLNIRPLISHTFDILDAVNAYDVLENDKSALGIILDYSSPVLQAKKTEKCVTLTKEALPASPVIVGFIGAGNYASRILIPAFKQAKAMLKGIASGRGLSAVLSAKKYGVAEALTDTQRIFNDEQINAAVIVTPHNMHAQQVIQALNAKKHVFVEKPLCLTLEELAEIDAAYCNASTLLMVGFNRRFSPQIKTAKKLLNTVAMPKTFIMTVNAGEIPSEHWTQDVNVGGGRIIGECCHFIDLLRFLAGAEIVSSHAVSISSSSTISEDKAIITLTFADGSCGSIHYLANGHKSFPKERLEIFCAGKIIQLDNFRKMTGYGWKEFKKQNLFRQDKGQGACVAEFIAAIENGKASPIPFSELYEVAKVTINVAMQLR